MRLKRKQKLRARELARKAWLESSGDKDEALRLVRVYIHDDCGLPEDKQVPTSEGELVGFIGSLVTILTIAYLMLKIAQVVIELWFSDGVQVPSLGASESGVDWDGNDSDSDE